ncbi:VRR-NUC domain-containing protein [Herbaspirillum rubrisubalbicans]|uniref:VRR-NUC domain-containing protein n=1 Tax=Herbaspirillum rubrisubalbicans TaxID=80842 RepID=A0AAD0UBE1_9BURK|nr:VRR-NUC domain-containing protein [Herbaspirillum rubrisubalbicans]AYR24520.1 VRR-NUC domain-containing protein [Herbaspirillum rubrisubalbicans]
MTEPTPPSAPLATGGMSREGTTTVVKINQPAVDFKDKKVLCSAICKCNDAPGIGKDGRSLKQSCVSSRLRELDKLLEHRSPYKPEVNYDMTKMPPEPIMDSSIETKVHDWLPGWISKYWEVDHGSPYLKGAGMIRRPDVITVLDPRKPPTQENIKQVVEIKFPPDYMDELQAAAYTRIAGDDSKLITIGPENCDCNQPEPEQSKIPIEQLGAASFLASILYTLLTKKPPPTTAPAF